MCAVVCICGAANVRELFKCVVVYFGGLAYMCSSLFIYFLFIVKLPCQNVNSIRGGIFVYFVHHILSV